MGMGEAFDEVKKNPLIERISTLDMLIIGFMKPYLQLRPP